ncbi:MAG: Unknown protein [uncultured Thiotrichaceae bacterium]|uniref:Uncharacterized protein n=1 Tax=uncultured Thiotrichaceae bacterium TaxID=298394 RepID=A0A6S6U2D1_9GAMM|nr:MAG: Unknown protein [uncultured Thiotrichaceae bacterium]
MKYHLQAWLIMMAIVSAIFGLLALFVRFL